MSRIHDAIAKANERREKTEALRPEGGGLPEERMELPPSHPLPNPAHHLPDVPPLPITNPMLMSEEPHFRQAREQFRKLKSEILTRIRTDFGGSGSLLVTSAFSGDGKTTLALNLALTLAREYDYTVLLIDGDLRQPRLESFLGIPQTPGLLQCLEAETILPDALRPTGHGNLVVMSAGGQAENAAEILSSARMKAFHDEIKGRYRDRIILFDTPPCSLFADAKVLSTLVDGILFVTRQGHGRPQKILECYKSLPREKHLGVIYNDAEISNFHSSYGSYYA